MSQESTLQELQSLIDSAQQLEKPAEPGPFDLSINGTTYHHIKDTENFYLDDPEDTLTPLDVMKREAKDILKSYTRRIKPPPDFYKLGDSSRFKILRAVQLHYAQPPITPLTKQFTPMFQHLSENVRDHWTIQQQFASCNWALKYTDPDKAASALIHFGYVNKQRPRMEAMSMHKLTVTDEGIHVDIAYPFSFQDRVIFACQMVQQEYTDARINGAHITAADLNKVALSNFFCMKGYFCSITAEYRQTIINKITAFIDREFNAIPDKINPYPEIDEPEDLLEEQEFLLRWEDFVFEKVSAAQQTQRVNNNKVRLLETLREKAGDLPQNTEIHRSELEARKIWNRTISAAQPEFISPGSKRGYYILHFPKEE